MKKAPYQQERRNKKTTVDVINSGPSLGNVLLSQDPSVQVPSALEGLTVVFGMGTRGTPPLSPPNVQVLDHLKTRYETNLHFI